MVLRPAQGFFIAGRSHPKDAPISRLLRLTRGCGGPIVTLILMGCNRNGLLLLRAYSTYDLTITNTLFQMSVRIQVRIGPPLPLVCRKRRLNGTCEDPG
jgi:hypothetical protein